MKTARIASLTAIAFALAGCATAPSGYTPAPAESCRPITEREVAALFERWNESLKHGAQKVVANYAPKSVLLPTLSATPRVTVEQKLEYFEEFLKKKPSGDITWRSIEIGCNSALDTGNYTFTFGPNGPQAKARFTYTYRWEGGQWLISSHHSSLQPDKP